MRAIKPSEQVNKTRPVIVSGGSATSASRINQFQTQLTNERQLWVHLLAYNVIRLLMAQAAGNAGIKTLGEIARNRRSGCNVLNHLSGTLIQRFPRQV